MRKTLIAGLALGALFVQLPGVQAAAMRVKGTRVVMERPEGFIDAPNFSGFALPGEAASVMVTEIPGPYPQVSAGFDEAHMKPRGMNLISKEPIKVGKFDGQLVQLTQSAQGVMFRKWINVFGDTSKTVMITAAFPDERATAFSDKLKAAVASAQYDAAGAPPDTMADLPFTISGTKTLKLAGRVQNALMFTPTGQMVQTPASTDSSMFIVAQALSDLDVGDKAAFARRRLRQSPGMTDLQILKESDVTVAGMPGREILATATGKKGEKLFIMQTMLFGLGSYFILQGLTDEAKRATREADFRALVQQFKLK